MNLEYTPQRSDNKLIYSVENDILTVTYQNARTGQEVTDTFDFTGLPDGKLEVDTITTTLPVGPIISAEKISGTLTLTLLRWYDASEKEQFENG